MKTVIIRYNAGNIRSVDFALRRLGVSAEITANHDKIRAADKVIFPGVGEASSTMKHLKENELDIVITKLKQPVLGICLGMQLMCNASEENNATGLGILDAKVTKFTDRSLKVPHMGWSRIYDLQSPLFCGIKEKSYVYFVHSYYLPDGNYTIAKTDYSGPFAAAAQQDNFFATQFHPEKSGEKGARILKNFIKL
jgi:glutamine amidotransferase